jgi:hypothetical protein
MRKLMIVLAMSLGSQAVAQEVPNALQNFQFDDVTVKTIVPVADVGAAPYEVTIMKVYGSGNVEEVFELVDNAAERGIQFSVDLESALVYSYNIRSENSEGIIVIDVEESSIKVVNQKLL